MRAYQVSLRYAKAFLDLAKRNDAIESAANDAETIFAALDGEHRLSKILSSPIITEEKKANILVEIFSGKISAITVEFIQFLKDKERVEALKGIMSAFKKLVDEHNGVVRVHIKSSVALEPKQISSIVEKFEKKLQKKVLYSTSTNEHLLGGFVVTVEDTVYDASVANKLKQLKKRFRDSEITRN